MNLEKINLTNKSILIDLSHVKDKGDEVVQGGIVLGTVQVSETPTYGVVLAYDPSLEGKVEVGDVIPLPTTGVLRMFEFPGKTKQDKVAVIRFDLIDGVVKP